MKRDRALDHFHAEAQHNPLAPRAAGEFLGDREVVHATAAQTSFIIHSVLQPAAEKLKRHSEADATSAQKDPVTQHAASDTARRQFN